MTKHPLSTVDNLLNSMTNYTLPSSSEKEFLNTNFFYVFRAQKGNEKTNQ